MNPNMNSEASEIFRNGWTLVHQIYWLLTWFMVYVQDVFQKTNFISVIEWVRERGVRTSGGSSEYSTAPSWINEFSSLSAGWKYMVCILNFLLRVVPCLLMCYVHLNVMYISLPFTSFQYLEIWFVVNANHSNQRRDQTYMTDSIFEFVHIYIP